MDPPRRRPRLFRPLEGDQKGLSWSIPPGEHRSDVQRNRTERGIWQRRFCEHTIRNDRDVAAHVDYIHFNPVKHGLVETPAQWPYSTFARAVARGQYPANWRGTDPSEAQWGERALDKPA